jgi:hypothetical protein
MAEMKSIGEGFRAATAAQSPSGDKITQGEREAFAGFVQGQLDKVQPGVVSVAPIVHWGDPRYKVTAAFDQVNDLGTARKLRDVAQQMKDDADAQKVGARTAFRQFFNFVDGQENNLLGVRSCLDDIVKQAEKRVSELTVAPAGRGKSKTICAPANPGPCPPPPSVKKP